MTTSLLNQINLFKELLERTNNVNAYKIKNRFRAISNELADPGKLLRRMTDLYPLHDQLIKISNMVRDLDIPEVVTGWSQFPYELHSYRLPLGSVHHMRVIESMERGKNSFEKLRTVKVSIRRALAALRKERVEIAFEVLHPQQITPQLTHEISKLCYKSLGEAYFEESLMDTLRKDRALVITARDPEKKLAGFVFGCADFMPITERELAFRVDILARSADLPSLGLGYQLMQKLEQEATKHFADLKSINLNTDLWNVAARKLYLKLGYEELGIHTEKVIMARNLNSHSSRVMYTAMDAIRMAENLLQRQPPEDNLLNQYYTKYYGRTWAYWSPIRCVARSLYLSTKNLLGLNKYFDFTR